LDKLIYVYCIKDIWDSGYAEVAFVLNDKVIDAYIVDDVSEASNPIYKVTKRQKYKLLEYYD